MKKLKLICFFICLSFSVTSQECNVDKKAQRLKELYEKVMQDENILLEFFNEFPDNFNCFNEVYGAGPKPHDFKPGPLYSQSSDHVNLFAELNSIIQDSIYIKKVVQIAFHGHWDADAVSYFKHEVIEKILDEKQKAFCGILKRFSDEDILSFWKFYFDGPHPPKEIPEKLERIQMQNSHVYKLLKEAHVEILKK